MSEVIERTLVGSVVSISGDKSRVALIQRSVKHKTLGKIIKRSSKISFHDEDNSSNLGCLLYTSPSPRDNRVSRMPSSA